MSTLETCHCGHDKATHHLEPGAGNVRAACLARFCTCTRYIHQDDPPPTQRNYAIKTVAKDVRPHMDTNCRCSGCNLYDYYHRLP